MKVLAVISDLDPKKGGPPEVIRNTLEVINNKKKILSVLKTDKISFFYLFKCLCNLHLRKKFNTFLQKFSVIHFHDIWSLKNILIIHFARKLSCKYLLTGHGHLDEWSLNQSYFKKKIFINFFLKSCIQSSDGFFFLNKGEYYEANKNIKIPNPFIIPNGININKFKKDKILSLSKKKIIFFGRIHKKKGIDILIDSIKLLPDNFFENFQFEICGPGEKKYVNSIKDKINRYNLEDKLSLKKFVKRDKKIDYLSKASIFVLPSFEEGDSIALKEALAMSIPVIISKQCRLDIVEEYNSGIVIDLSVNNLSNALMKISKKDLISMGIGARRLIVDKFDNIICCKRILKIYKDIHCGSKISKDWIL